MHPNDSSFDRSESHCRRWEAWRNRRDVYYYNRRSKWRNKIKETSSANEEELAEEEKDSFHSQPHVENDQIFNNLNSKLSRAFGNCIDERDVSPTKWMPHSDICRSNMGTVSPHNENMAEADKARIGYRPMLSKKSRELKVNKFVILECHWIKPSF